MSAPITIPVSPARSSSSLSSSPASPGLYVPVHKRTGSSSSSSSSRSSSSTRSERASQPRKSTPTPGTSIPTNLSPAPATPQPEPTFIYSRDTLLALAASPLSRISVATRDTLRTRLPELVTNRKQRKAMDYHANARAQAQAKPTAPAQAKAPAQAQTKAPAQVQTKTPAQTQPKPQPLQNADQNKNPVRATARRTRPVGRTADRRRNATKVVDEASWRGRRPALVEIVL